MAILAFPCNQFGKVNAPLPYRFNKKKTSNTFLFKLLQQEPGGSDMEVLNGIRYVRPGDNFQPKMNLFKKIDVNGDKEHPLFTYLKVNDIIFILLIY